MGAGRPPPPLPPQWYGQRPVQTCSAPATDPPQWYGQPPVCPPAPPCGSVALGACAQSTVCILKRSGLVSGQAGPYHWGGVGRRQPRAIRLVNGQEGPYHWGGVGRPPALTHTYILIKEFKNARSRSRPYCGPHFKICLVKLNKKKTKIPFVKE